MSLSHQQNIALASLKALNPVDCVDPTFAAAIVDLLDTKRQEWNTSEAAERLKFKAAVSRNRRRERTIEISRARQQWAIENLQVGMIVIMDGTRDGGLRRIIRKDRHQIVAIQQARPGPYTKAERWVRRGSPAAKAFGALDGTQITTHSWDKVKEYGVVDEDGTIILVKVPT